MRRREFITGIGGAIFGGAAALRIAWPPAASAQQRSLPVIGFLAQGTPNFTARDVAVPAFRRGLSQSGYVDGQSVAVDYRWADYRQDRLTAMASDLVRRPVTAILALGTPAALAAKAATSSIPIVFSIGSDPIAAGLVARLDRPGGNVTGVSNFGLEAAAKRLELLHELVPNATTIAILANPANAKDNDAEMKELQAAAAMLGLRLVVVNASDPSDFEKAFASIARERAEGLLVGSDTLFFAQADQLAALAARFRLPAIYDAREFVNAGGLLSYGPDLSNPVRQAAIYVGRILKGDKPADLPIRQPTRVELVLNLRIAKALRIEVPTATLLRADIVIE
jgi:putative tryptophan/tyrosine transport system substrate-binding protein